MPILDINNEAVIGLTAKLERLNKSAFPSAVRNTLNRAAFETKKNIPLVTAQSFITREKTFFRRFSIVDKANGFAVNSLKATVGINAGMNRDLAKNLEAQETGGLVRGRKLVPHDDSRVSKSQKKKVSRSNYMNKVKIHNATRAMKAHRGTKSSKFVAAVISTVKSGKKHMLLTSGTRGMVYEVNSVSSNRRTGKIKFRLKKLYTFRNKKNHTVKATRFMERSAEPVRRQMDKFYKENAEFQFKKVLR